MSIINLRILHRFFERLCTKYYGKYHHKRKYPVTPLRFKIASHIEFYLRNKIQEIRRKDGK